MPVTGFGTGVDPEWTTLPRYPRIGPSTAPHLVVSAAPIDRPPRDRVLTGVTDMAAAVRAELPRLVTGWRVLLVGPERDVQAGRAAALAAGALDAEVTVVATDAEDPWAARDRRVFCGACHHRFDARAGIGDPVACPGCRASLTVDHHHSRRHGAFLGVPGAP